MERVRQGWRRMERDEGAPEFSVELQANRFWRRSCQSFLLCITGLGKTASITRFRRRFIFGTPSSFAPRVWAAGPAAGLASGDMRSTSRRGTGSGTALTLEDRRTDSKDTESGHTGERNKPGSLQREDSASLSDLGLTWRTSAAEEQTENNEEERKGRE